MLSKLGNNRIGGDLLACSSRGFEQRTDQTEDLKFGACCFSAKHTTLRGVHVGRVEPHMLLRWSRIVWQINFVNGAVYVYRVEPYMLAGWNHICW